MTSNHAPPNSERRASMTLFKDVTVDESRRACKLLPVDVFVLEKRECPFSDAIAMAGSSGRLPKYLTPAPSHIFNAPPRDAGKTSMWIRIEHGSCMFSEEALACECISFSTASRTLKVISVPSSAEAVSYIHLTLPTIYSV